MGNEKTAYRALREKMNDAVIGQENYVEKLCATFVSSDRQSWARSAGSRKAYPANTMLVAGETGSGKTYAVKQLAEFTDRELIEIDMSFITGSGYKGDSLMDTIERKVRGMNPNDVRDAIFFFDEFDKCILCKDELTRSKTASVVPEFLKLLEDGMIDVQGESGDLYRVSVQNAIFIFAGAFAGIEEIIEKRLLKGKKQIGFNAEKSEEQIDETQGLISSVDYQDFAEYGVDWQFLGRMERVCALNRLCEADFARIIVDSKDSDYNKHKQLFLDAYGIDVKMLKSAQKLIARGCVEKGIGARGAKGIVTKIFDDCLVMSQDDLGIGLFLLFAKDEEIQIKPVHCERNPIYEEKMKPHLGSKGDAQYNHGQSNPSIITEPRGWYGS